MLKEFTTDVLYQWRAKGVRFIGIRLEQPALLLDEETDEFLVRPFNAQQDAETFLTEEMPADPLQIEALPYYFPIDSGEAYEIAAGISGCRFFTRQLVTND